MKYFMIKVVAGYSDSPVSLEILQREILENWSSWIEPFGKTRHSFDLTVRVPWCQTCV